MILGPQSLAHGVAKCSWQVPLLHFHQKMQRLLLIWG